MMTGEPFSSGERVNTSAVSGGKFGREEAHAEEGFELPLDETLELALNGDIRALKLAHDAICDAEQLDVAHVSYFSLYASTPTTLQPPFQEASLYFDQASEPGVHDDDPQMTWGSGIGRSGDGTRGVVAV